MDNIVVVENLRKTYGKDIIAVDGISFRVHVGEIFGFLGPNGAGKTTLLNLIAGTYLPDEGKVFIDGREVTLLPEYQRAKYLGRIFQNPLMGRSISAS
jgi:putative ABC transport system ATP-binding protein